MGTQACQTQAQGGTPPPHSAKYHHRRFIYKQLENGQKTNVSTIFIHLFPSGEQNHTENRRIAVFLSQGLV